MHVEEHHSVKELHQLIRKQTRARLVLRLQMVLLAKQGQTAPQIARLLGGSRRLVQKWVYRYNAEGVEGLGDAYRGAPRRLTDSQEQQVRDHLDQQAQDPQAGVRRGEDLRQWIAQHFGVVYAMSGLYHLLHRLGYSCLMPRPRHHKADLAAQEAFKKTRWSRFSESPKSIPQRRSRSGSRMRPASASKAR